MEREGESLCAAPQQTVAGVCVRLSSLAAITFLHLHQRPPFKESLLMPAKPYAPINPGDEVALIAPSSPLPDPADLLDHVAACEGLGLKVRRFPTLELRVDYMAGTAKQRAADITKAFLDPKIKAVLCLRGGFSAAHTLPLLDLKKLGATRKLFSGFSDLTMLLNPLMSVGGLMTLHAPTMGVFRKADDLTNASREALKQFLFGGIDAEYSYRGLCEPHFQPVTLRKGRAEGRIVGGNLSVFVTMIGTPWMPKTGGPFILFIEDVHEKAYKLDRYLTHLIQSGFMKNVAGVAVGQFTDCAPAQHDQGAALAVIGRTLAPLKIPVLAGFPIGHDLPSYPLPIGAKAVLDATKGDLVVRVK